MSDAQVGSAQPGSPDPATGAARPRRNACRRGRCVPAKRRRKGTAVIKGQVRAAGTGAPVRRAQVRAMSMEARGGGVTSTDGNGRFEIKELPAGRYTVTVMKGGFAQAQFGQRRPGEPGTPIELADGQTAEKVNFVLSRGGVISGTVVDDGGEPMAGTQVAAMRYQFMAGHAPARAGAERRRHRSHRRPRRLPAVRLAAGRLLRQRQQSQQQCSWRAGMNNTEPDGFAPTYYPGTPNVDRGDARHRQRPARK